MPSYANVQLSNTVIQLTGRVNDLSSDITSLTGAGANTVTANTITTNTLISNTITSNTITANTITINGTGTVDGRDVSADGSKLDGIESGATADQTAGEIKSLYESNANTNVFTDADVSKLAGIKAGSDVTGPASATDNDLARFDGTTGKLLKAGGTISTAEIANTAVTTVKIANSAVTIAKLEDTTKDFTIPFIAGKDSTMTAEDVVVQTYMEFEVGVPFSLIDDGGTAGTAPTGSAAILDITKNGTTVYTSKPEFAAAATSLTGGTFKTDGTEDFASGDTIAFKVTQIGSSTAGQAFDFWLKARMT